MGAAKDAASAAKDAKSAMAERTGLDDVNLGSGTLGDRAGLGRLTSAVGGMSSVGDRFGLVSAISGMTERVTDITVGLTTNLTEGVSGLTSLAAANVGSMTDRFRDTRPTVAFTIKCTSHTAMKQGNCDRPYVMSREPVALTLQLKTAAKVEPLFRQLEELVAIMGPTTARSWARPARLQELIDEREDAMAFDLANLVDFTEGEVFSCKAERITPLVSNPGRVVLTDKRLYFQPFNTVQAAGLEKWNLRGASSGLQGMQRQRHQLRRTGVELRFGTGSVNREDLFLALPSNAERGESTSLYT
jgi:hypothetical protein